MLGGFSKNILTKIEIARPPVVRSTLKPSQVGFDMYRFGWYEREVQENSVARDWLRPRFWKCAPFSRKLRSLDDFPTFCNLSISMVHEWSQWIEAILALKWLVETEILLLSKSNTLQENRRANRGENARRIFQKYFDKNRDCSASCGQIYSKTVPGGLWSVPVRMVWARGPGKFCSQRLTAAKVLKMCSILKKVALARWFPYFL
jgi:hypothetical protein